MRSSLIKAGRSCDRVIRPHFFRNVVADIEETHGSSAYPLKMQMAGKSTEKVSTLYTMLPYTPLRACDHP